MDDGKRWYSDGRFSDVSFALKGGRSGGGGLKNGVPHHLRRRPFEQGQVQFSFVSFLPKCLQNITPAILLEPPRAPERYLKCILNPERLSPWVITFREKTIEKSVAGAVKVPSR